MEFDMAQAKADISEFNGSLSHLAGDFLMHEFFRGDDFVAAEFEPVRVLLVDVLWSTQVNREGTRGRREEEKPLHLLCAHLRRQFGELEERLEPLLDLDLPEQKPESVSEHACAALRLVFETPGMNNKPLSFASKFLHWLAPRCCPIIDERARTATHKLLPELWAQVRLRKQRTGNQALDEKVHKFRRWVKYYSLLLQKLANAQQEELTKHDYETQNHTSEVLARRNTILRVLDKHFWIHGKHLVEQEQQ